MDYDQIEAARAGRNISDIPSGDGYWSLVEQHRQAQERAPLGVGEKKEHPLQTAATRRASAIDDAINETRRIEEAAEKEGDKEEEFDDEDEVEADDLDDDEDGEEEHDDEKQAPQLSGGFPTTGMTHLDDATLQALSSAGDSQANAELVHRRASSQR